MLTYFLDLFFPPGCVGCGSFGIYICQKCQKNLAFRPLSCAVCDQPAIDGWTHPRCQGKYTLDRLITVFTYKGVIQKAIKTLKYRFVSYCAQNVIHLIPQAVFTSVNHDFVLFPIPLHSERLRWRGFNQAEKLGQFVAQRLQIPLVTQLLKRHKQLTPQAEITTREARLKNAKGIFTLNMTKLPPKIILFDDVWTTGATMTEAAKILKKGGVQKIIGFTLAR